MSATNFCFPPHLEYDPIINSIDSNLHVVLLKTIVYLLFALLTISGILNGTFNVAIL